MFLLEGATTENLASVETVKKLLWVLILIAVAILLFLVWRYF